MTTCQRAAKRVQTMNSGQSAWDRLMMLWLVHRVCCWAYRSGDPDAISLARRVGL